MRIGIGISPHHAGRVVVFVGVFWGGEILVPHLAGWHGVCFVDGRMRRSIMKRAVHISAGDIWEIADNAGIESGHVFGIMEHIVTTPGEDWTIDAVRSAIVLAARRGIVPASTLTRFDESAKSLCYG